MEVHEGDESINTSELNTSDIQIQTYFAEPDIVISTASQSSFKCSECSLDFANYVKLETHNREVHGQIKIECPICHTLFRRRDHLRRHMRTVHSADKPICPICSHDCKDHDSLSLHMRDTHPNESHYHCTECQYSADDLKSLVSHKKVHVVINKHVCNICHACFKRQDHLNRHIKSLHLNQFVTCEICKQIFKRRDHLQRHMREQHGRIHVAQKISRR